MLAPILQVTSYLCPKFQTNITFMCVTHRSSVDQNQIQSEVQGAIFIWHSMTKLDKRPYRVNMCPLLVPGDTLWLAPTPLTWPNTNAKSYSNTKIDIIVKVPCVIVMAYEIKLYCIQYQYLVSIAFSSILHYLHVFTVIKKCLFFFVYKREIHYNVLKSLKLTFANVVLSLLCL